MSGLAELVGQRSVIVCCGSGGVGKTTTAAAIALRAAEEGRRACVVTIDPAKRLADALGLEALTNAPKLVEGQWPGELWALMLDTKGTFDDLVSRYAADPGQAENILTNRVYRNLSSALSGTQEYMASEKLYELHEEERFDLVVVDTPPTRNALDFIDAPRRLLRFLDNRVFRFVMTPTRTYLRAVSVATRTILRTISKVVGAEVVEDAVTFFQAFEGMEEGFRARAQRVMELLRSKDCAFVLVASPRTDTVAEALFFADKLADAGIEVQGLVVNRLHPRFPEQGPSTGPAEPRGEGGLAVLERNLADFRAVAEREESNLAVLAERVSPAPVARIPFLAGDVHDLDGLAQIADHLFG